MKHRNVQYVIEPHTNYCSRTGEWIVEAVISLLTDAHDAYIANVFKHTSFCIRLFIFYMKQINSSNVEVWNVTLSWILTVHSVNVDLKENIFELGT